MKLPIKGRFGDIKNNSFKLSLPRVSRKSGVFFTETWLHLIMLKGDTEIHFLDRTVDHPITVRKLIPSTSQCRKWRDWW